jgi:putative ABC transport system permease protein
MKNPLPEWWRYLRARRDDEASESGSIRFGDVVRVAVSQLREGRVFFYANVIAISVGVLLIVVMLSIAVGVRRYVDRTLQKEASADMIEVSSDARVAAAPPLTYAHLGELALIPNVHFVYPVVQGIFAEVSARHGSSTFVSLASTVGKGDPELTRYVFLAGGVDALHGDSLVIPDGVMRQFGMNEARAAIGRKVSLRLTRAGVHGDESVDLPLTIAAVARATRFSRCYVTLPLAQRILRWQDHVTVPGALVVAGGEERTFVFDTVYVYANSVGDVARIRETVERRGYQTASILDSIRRYQQILFVATVVLTSLGAIALFAGAISIFNASYASVMRRLREFAIYKTYGATRGAIVRLVLAEAVITATFAGLIGFAAAAVVCLVLQRFAAGQVDAILFPIEWWLSLVAEATAFVACVLAAIGPAQIAARLTPVEVFRIG